jgi:hypothetical protein
MYQVQWIWNSHVLAYNAHLIRSPWYLEKDPFDQTYWITKEAMRCILFRSLVVSSLKPNEIHD